MSSTRKLIESLTEDESGPQALQEGNIIIVNGDGSNLPALLGQLAPDDSLSRTSTPDVRPVDVPSNDRMNFEADGRRWKFRINRDREGRIIDLEVQEVNGE